MGRKESEPLAWNLPPNCDLGFAGPGFKLGPLTYGHKDPLIQDRWGKEAFTKVLGTTEGNYSSERKELLNTFHQSLFLKFTVILIRMNFPLAPLLFSPSEQPTDPAAFIEKIAFPHTSLQC